SSTVTVVEAAGETEDAVAGAVEMAAVDLHEVSVEESSTQQPGNEDVVGPHGWLEWVAAIAVDPEAELDLNVVSTWAPAWTVDAELAAAISDLPSLAEDALLTGVAA